MATGFAVAAAPKGTTHKYNGRVTMFVVLSCAMASMGGFILGYDIGISGGVTSMAPFLKKFFPDVYLRMRADTNISNYCKFDSHLLTLFTSSLYIAGLFASFVASFFNEAYGRRPTILVGGAAFLAGSALNGAAVSIYMLIFGRVLLGVGVGFANQAVPLYLSEMAPAKYRGAFNNGFQFSLGIGALSANLINYTVDKTIPSWGWRLSLALAGVPASALALGALFLPETPNSLIQRTGNHEKAERMLQRIRGTGDVRSELDDLIGASENSKAMDNDSPYRKFMQKRYRPQLVMSFLIPFFQQVTGINVIAFYAPVVSRTIGFGESASLLSSLIMTGAAGSASTFASMLVVDRLGRRFLLISGGAVMLATNVVVGVVLGVKLGDRGGLSDGYAYLVLVMIGIYVAGFSVSWGPLGWLIPSEIFPLEIRSAGQSVTVAVNFLFTFVVGQTSLSMLCRMKAGIFLFYGGWVAVMTVFVWLFLPETKNVPIERMEKVWREHWYWKKIIGSL